MILCEIEISGVYVIKPEPFSDERGIFRRHFCSKEFSEHSIVTNVEQCNVSENKFKYTLRGFHYQVAPHGEGKTLSCFKGSMFDVVVDIRPKSKTYLKWIGVELSEANRNSVHVPPGCANAFLTLEDNTVIHYYCSYPYTPEAERGIRYNDPFFKFDWPAKPSIISEKDRNIPDFNPEQNLKDMRER